jgi:hypothetical protein
MHRTRRIRWAIIAVLLLFMLFAPATAKAWKPFAHNYTGDQAYADAVDDGSVTVGGHSYPLEPRLVSALRDWPQFYNAGVVGPDGFPDIAYGQSQIHPVHTGKWLRYLVDRAWAAQTDSGYSGDEQAQILAFTYGFLTHAAGDMWGHTLVNDFAGGVFPSFKEFINPDKAKIALGHIVAEGYAGNATPGWDRSTDEDDRAEVCTPPDPPGTNCNDVSDDQTHGIPFDAPHGFIYNTLVDPRVPLPVGTCDDGHNDDPWEDAVADDGCPGQRFTVGSPEPQRGPLLDFFLDLEATVQIKAADYRFDADHTNCATIDPDCFAADQQIVVHTVRGDMTIAVDATRCDATFFCVGDPVDAAVDLVNGLIAGYLEAWVDDIEDGLRDWNELGLGITKGLFDPQTRRDAQNDECHTRGPESSLVRANCENGIGAFDAILFATDDYINDHMLSMLGLPDAVGPIREALEELSDLLDEIVGPALNPFRLAIDELKEVIHDMIKDAIRDATGIDVEELKGFLTHPTRWMCGDAGVSITLPSVGTITGAGLFSAPEHARLDAIMGLESDHHEVGTTISTDCSPLEDDTEYDPNEFAAIKNTITDSKLLLLDGTLLDQALGDVLADGGVIKSPSLVHTYQASDNVMFTALGTANPWLELIDGDHAWRQDGLPRFCNSATSCSSLPAELASYPRQPTPRDTNPVTGELLNGGTGRHPIWESCVLRPAFRGLYDDWENDANPGETNFPDLGDTPSVDASDPDAPITTLVAGGTTFVSGGTTFIGADNEFTVTATDDVFTDDFVGLRYRVFLDGTTAGPFVTIDSSDSFSISGPDGLYHIELQAEDPCHTFDPTDSLSAGTVLSESFVLDTTGPEIDITSPAPEGVVFDTDDASTIAYSVSDAGGSGVASSSVTLDGAPATNGQVLDMFFLAPGLHTIVVTATDNLGNTSSATRTFEVHATAESLNNNIDRACNLGLIKATLCNALKAKTKAALAAHNRGQHATEHNILRALIHQLEAKRGKGVDAATADRLIAFIQDLIARGA